MNRSPFDKYIVPIVIEKMNLHICNMFTYNKNNCTIEVKAILIAVHNIENVGLNSKKVLLNSIEWLRCQYEITQDESFLIKAVWHIYAYLELGYPYISGELEFNRILNCLQLDINTVFPKKGWAYKKVALKKSNINQILGRWHPHFQSREFYIPLWKNAGAEG